MARASVEAEILEALDKWEVLFLPHSSQSIARSLLYGAHKKGIFEFRHGNGKPMNLDDIAFIIPALKPRNNENAEPSFETQVSNLVSVGLLSRAADGAIGCPLLAKPNSRAEASRNNGLLGGRPKKGTKNMPKSAPRVSHHTNRAKTREPNNDNPGFGNTTYLLKESSKKVSSEGEAVTEYHDIGLAALEAAGLDPARSMATYKPVAQWLADGADAKLILDVIRRKTGPHVTTLKYFDKAIAEAIAARPVEKPLYEREWDEAYKNWEVLGRGFEPMPRLDDFKKRFAS